MKGITSTDSHLQACLAYCFVKSFEGPAHLHISRKSSRLVDSALDKSNKATLPTFFQPEGQHREEMNVDISIYIFSTDVQWKHRGTCCGHAVANLNKRL